MSRLRRAITALVLLSAAIWLESGQRLVRAAAPDIVLYSSDVSVIAGIWSRASSTTGAGGLKMTTPDNGWSTPDAPFASPQNYFEATFDAPAATTYQVWLRLRAAADSKWNESVWVQFSDALDGAGNPLWRIGTTSALLVNLEDCIGCGVSSWGWQDNASWTGQSARVRFAGAGPHTMRVQVREDGVDIDQIVLSPSQWLASAPGALRNDTTIVPKPSSTPVVTIVRQPYLQQVTASSAIIVWATMEGGAGRVQYQTAAGAGGTIDATSRLVPANVTGMAFSYYQHEALLSGLSSATAVTYQASVGGVGAGSAATFTTAPGVGSGTVRFIAFGDSGVGSAAQMQLAALMNGESFDLALHTGDMVYAVNGGPSGTYQQQHSLFFDVYKNWLRSHPVFPTIGNHDDESNFAAPYKDLFVLPTNGASVAHPDHAERYYSFDYGPAHIVVLDTELALQDPSRRGEQVAWLADDLARTAQPWKIAVFHRPPFSAGAEHGPDPLVQSEFVPIFESYGVSLVLSGHEHDYERTVPWSQAGGRPVTYIVTGGGGAPLYPAGIGPWTAVSRSVNHYLRGAVSACTISIEAVGLDGAVFDSTHLERCTTPPSNTPYGGVAAVIPGVVQAENFDEGGPEVAYHDLSAGNAGGAYRQTDVDLEQTSDAGGGHNVGWMAPTEWLAYSVNVTSPGTYTIEARVAANGPGGVFHLEMNRSPITGALAVPNTGGWQNWQSVSVSGVTLAAGPQQLRVVVDGTGSTGVFGNLNYLRISAAGATPSTPYGGVAATIPGVVQAENFDEGGSEVAYRDSTSGNAGGSYRTTTDVDLEPAADSGGGYDVGWLAPGEWLAYSVNVASAGSYVLDVRVAANGPGGTFHIEANGSAVTGPLMFPNTGGWQAWQSVTVTGVPLSAGPQRIRVVIDGAGITGVVGNINYLRFTPAP